MRGVKGCRSRLSRHEYSEVELEVARSHSPLYQALPLKSVHLHSAMNCPQEQVIPKDRLADEDFRELYLEASSE